MNEVIDIESHGPRAVANTTPSDLLRMAVEQGADMEKLERLMALQERWEANQARKAYVESMAEFKRNPPEILKDKKVNFKTDKGTTSYTHASIGNVVEKIVGGLAEHGFSHRWIPRRSEGGMISITCVITHKLGHSEETTLEAGLDQSGGKNNIQAMISTKTYLERHSLLAATGLATSDTPDDDGRSAETPMPPLAEKTVARPYCTDKKFADNKSAWRQIILDKKKTAEGLIVFLESKFELSESQKLTIDAWAHEND